jgi:hypothetical protein
VLAFCTYFDRNYLARGLALYASLRRHCGAFSLWTLCLDEETQLSLERIGLPGLHVVSLAQLESDDTDLLARKSSRSTLEYYYTCGPALMLHVLRTRPDIDLLTCLDADMFFFADPAPALAELTEASVGLASHRVVDARTVALYGEFNDGWVSFRSDADGLDALGWWRTRCLESCSIHLEAGICGPQKYLDELPPRSSRVVVLKHPGANLGFWNYFRFQYDRVAGRVFVQGQPLLWFHFGDFLLGWRWWLHPNYSRRFMFPSRLVRRWVLAPYARTLHQLGRALAPGGAIARRTGVALTPRLHPTASPAPVPGLIAWGLRLLRLIRRVGNHVFFPFRRGGPLEPEVGIILAEMEGRGPWARQGREPSAALSHS